MMVADPPTFKAHVQETLRRHVAAVNVLTAKGMKFWDYGNSFLLEASRAGADVGDGGDDGKTFRYPSYVQDIMGDIFSLGFGPFRWVCTSGNSNDLRKPTRLQKKSWLALRKMLRHARVRSSTIISCGSERLRRISLLLALKRVYCTPTAQGGQPLLPPSMLLLPQVAYRPL